MASKLSSLNYSKRGKLSKREYAASQLGGKLDYKSGKITVPAKQPAKTAPKQNTGYKSMSFGDAVFEAPTGRVDAATVEANTISPELRAQHEQSAVKANSREAASKVYNTGKVAGASTSRAFPGVNTAQASNGQSPKPLGGGVKGWIKQQAQDLINFRNQSNDIARAAGGDVSKNTDWNISEILGIPKANIIGESVELNPTLDPTSSNFEIAKRINENPDLIGANDDILSGKKVDWSTIDTGITGRNNSAADIDYSSMNTESDNHSNADDGRPNPKQVTNPFVRPQQSNPLTDAIRAYQGQESNPFPSPIQNNPGTVRRPFGNGSAMSNGAFSNGKGYSGLEGASLGMDTGQMENEGLLDNLLTTLGIKPMTAQAQEMPQQPMAFGQPQQNFLGQVSQPKNDYVNSDVYKNLMNSLYGQDQQEAPTPRPQSNPGGSQGGGVAQQFAQPVNPAQAQYEQAIKGYGSQAKDTEKAYKRALASMLKGIEAEYATAQTQGTQSLDKQKQEDLLRQSGLFNFANQDPNSEQRMQYDARMNQDYAGQLTDLLAKLTQGKSKDILSAKSDIEGRKSSALDQISSAKSSAQQNLAQLLYSMQQKQPKTGSPAVPKSTKPSHKEIFDYVNASDGTWEEIAQDAEAQGLDTSTGSYLDQLLNKKFRG